MTEAVPLDELLHEEALFGLTGVRKVGVPRGRFFFASPLYLDSRVVWAWPDPLPTRLKRVGKNVQTLWWAELDRLHSMTCAHPPLRSRDLIYLKLVVMDFLKIIFPSTDKNFGLYVALPILQSPF